MGKGQEPGRVMADRHRMTIHRLRSPIEHGFAWANLKGESQKSRQNSGER